MPENTGTSTPAAKADDLPEGASPEVMAAIKRWKDKRGNLIMVLHEIQDQRGFVPRDTALYLAREMNVPLARIYEVITFYHYFKLEAPGKAIISVCTGTPCYLKGASALVAEFEKDLGIPEGQSTPDKLFHLQSVRCVGCCGLAPVTTVNGKTYGKLTPVDIKKITNEWREKFAKEAAEAEAAQPSAVS